MKNMGGRTTIALIILVGTLGLMDGIPRHAEALLFGGPDIIDPPDDVRDNGATNLAQQAFNEQQAVLLEEDLEVDSAPAVGGGVFIPAGRAIDSHMIFINPPISSGTITDFGVEWEFEGPILGVMSDTNGALEAASTPILGVPDTKYHQDPFNNRGMEPDAEDTYVVDGNTIRVDMRVIQPGDWIRVVTVSCEFPESREEEQACQCSSVIQLHAQRVAPGELLGYTITLNHRREQTVQTPFFISILDSDGDIISYTTTPEYTMHPGDHLTFRQKVRIPPDTQAGRYRLEVGIGDMKQGFVSTRTSFLVLPLTPQPIALRGL